MIKFESFFPSPRMSTCIVSKGMTFEKNYYKNYDDQFYLTRSRDVIKVSMNMRRISFVYNLPLRA